MKKQKSKEKKQKKHPQSKSAYPFKWDSWQKEVLKTQGHITIRSGRQVGKSEVIAAKASKFAVENEGTTTLIIAASRRQSSLLFEKVRGYLDQEGDIYADKPTLTKVTLKNGSRIYSLPAGRTGYFIRGFTIDMLIADEAAYIPETVWNAVIPMIAVSRKARGMGYLVLLSTPFGKGGFFFNSFTDPDFRSFHVSSEDCDRIPKGFLKKEKSRMAKAEYAQEYKGEFIDEWNQFFKTRLIKEQMTFIEWTKKKDGIEGANYYLGVDLARYGGDEVAMVIVEMHNKRLKAVKCITRDRVSTTHTVGEIGIIDEIWKFKRIFVDSGGLGQAVLDQLEEKMGKRRIVGLDNSKKGIEVEGEEKRVKILKEDLYSNTLKLLEIGRLELISDMALLRSMKSITFQYTSEKKIKLFGNYSHLTEALVRACWCIKDKGLDIYIY